MDEINDKQQQTPKWQKRQQRYQEFLQGINLCPLCSSPLTLIHEVDKEAGYIEELAHCSECQLETRKKDHTIQ